MPSLKAALANLRAPVPFPSKLRRIIVNASRKVRTLRNCCGHPGEPGC
jgi:hypothetical protein